MAEIICGLPDKGRPQCPSTFSILLSRVSMDLEGSELDSLPQARIEAVVYAASMLRDRPEEVWAGGNWRVEVADECGALRVTEVVMALERFSRV